MPLPCIDGAETARTKANPDDDNENTRQQKNNAKRYAFPFLCHDIFSENG
jgi:hypothetical protein